MRRKNYVSLRKVFSFQRKSLGPFLQLKGTVDIYDREHHSSPSIVLVIIIPSTNTVKTGWSDLQMRGLELFRFDLPRL